VGSSEISLPHVGLEETLTWLFGSFLAANGLYAIADLQTPRRQFFGDCDSGNGTVTRRPELTKTKRTKKNSLETFNL